MSKKEHLVINRESWESMRYLDEKLKIKERYLEILSLYDEELDDNML